MIKQIAKFVGAGAACAALAVACHSSSPTVSSSSGEQAAAAEAKAVPEVTVTQVASFTKDKSATVFDANDADTRKEFGVVPGAVLLAGKDLLHSARCHLPKATSSSSIVVARNAARPTKQPRGQRPRATAT